ncbi:MAG: sugar phosphate nucleotidyltransferase [bacterium]|nr:sugar phosphate nucleotidyltransferase [bacterium]
MQAVVIAAGHSSRFWPLNYEHKSQFRLLGHPLVYWTIQGLVEAGITDIVVVVSKDSTLPDTLGRWGDHGAVISYVTQDKQLGTGNALAQARASLAGPFVLIWPNKVNSFDMVKRMLELRLDGKAEIVIVGAHTDNPPDYGIIEFSGDQPVSIVENPKLGEEPSRVMAVGAFLFDQDFFAYYDRIQHHHEADLIEAVNMYMKEKQVALLKIESDVPTLKYPWQVLDILDIMLASSRFKAQIAPTAQIGRNVILRGEVEIGENAKIGDNTVIEGPAYIGEGCEIGDANVLRGPLDLEAGVKTRSFFELKHSVVQEDTHFHSGYLGDSVVGSHCRFGAGFVTGNRRLDRKTVKTKVKGSMMDTELGAFGLATGRNVKFGIQTGTMPGVFVGSDSIILPGAQLFSNVEDGTRVFVKQSEKREQV